MDYCIVNSDGIIDNMIVCDGEDAATAFGALPSYDGAMIGQKYEPPSEPELETEPTVWDELAAAYKEGVNSAYEQ